jgi:hypothetical protein
VRSYETHKYTLWAKRSTYCTTGCYRVNNSYSDSKYGPGSIPPTDKQFIDRVQFETSKRFCDAVANICCNKNILIWSFSNKTKLLLLLLTFPLCDLQSYKDRQIKSEYKFKKKQSEIEIIRTR